jgi:hypothetical protein
MNWTGVIWFFQICRIVEFEMRQSLRYEKDFLTAIIFFS